MAIWGWSSFLGKASKLANRKRGPQRGQPLDLRRRLRVEQLEDRFVPSGMNPNQIVNSGLSPVDLAQSLVGAGVSVSNVQFTGNAAAAGNFSFTDPTVVGFSQGILLSSGSAADVVGPNLSDWTSTDFASPGDANLDALSGYPTYDAAVLEFDFVPTANQVVFNYTFASDEYPEWVSTPFNDVFAFYVNGTNYADVRQVAGDPSAPFVPVAVNNINNGNPLYPDVAPMRSDLFRANYYGSSATDLELDGITRVLTFQAPVNPGVVNHMKLAIADASDGIYDSAVFIQAGSLVSNEDPVADLSLSPSSGAAPLLVTAIVEGEDPNGLPLMYTIDWGDGTFSTGPLDQPNNDSEKTALVDHTYTAGGEYFVTLTVSNGTLSGTSIEDVKVLGGNTALVVTGNPADQAVFEGELFVFSASASGVPAPSVQWQVSTDSGASFTDIFGATDSVYSATASLADSGNLYQAVFSNSEGSFTTTAALLTVTALDITPPAAPGVMLTEDTGIDSADLITQLGTLTLSGVEAGASVEYSIDGGMSWSGDFNATEGLNTVLVRQSDMAGNVSDATTLSFTLDTTSPAALDVALADDTGSDSTDALTQVGMLSLNAVEAGASVEYSIDGGMSWNGVFNATEGLNTVLVRQTDVAGNVSDATTFSFALDTTLPTALGVALKEDTGSSSTDKITQVGTLNLSGVEAGASVEYSIDSGMSWNGVFDATEGLNTVLVRQTDMAGNVSDAATFSFTLDITPPSLNPSFSSTQPFLVNAVGITVSVNASDEWGIASQSSGMVITSSAGRRFVICTATDNAGNSASVSIPYVVGYRLVNVVPLAGTTFKHQASIPVSFRLADANGLISDQSAISLVPNIKVSLDGQPSVGVKYNKKTNTFSATLKTGKLKAGVYDVAIKVTVGSIDVATAFIPVKLL